MPDVYGKEVAVDDTAGGTQLFPGLVGRYHIRFENLDGTDSIPTDRVSGRSPGTSSADTRSSSGGPITERR